jgi:hypothetical protein
MQAANAALTAAKDASTAAIAAAAWITSHGTSLVDVREIRLSGNLKAIVSGGNAFNAEVKGQAAGQPFDLELSFDPRQTGKFLADLFQQ